MPTKKNASPRAPGAHFKTTVPVIIFKTFKTLFMTPLAENTALTNKRSNVVEYSSYDNMYHLRSFLLRKNREPNAFQLVQQEMFSKAADFVLTLSPVLLLNNRTISQTAHLSSVMSYVYRKAITYSSKGFSINYPRVLVSHGNLLPAETAATKTSPGYITFSWNNNAGSDSTRGFDKAILVVYCEALNKCIHIIGETRRRDEEAILEVPQFHGYEVQTWLSFISADERNLADSIHTGALFIT